MGGNLSLKLIPVAKSPTPPRDSETRSFGFIEKKKETYSCQDIMFFDTFQNETTDPIFGTTEDGKCFDRNENKSCRADSKQLGGKCMSEV